MEDAITTYYQKKASYDNEYQFKKETILKDNNLSLSEKREKINKIPRKCIVCKSTSGTIFSVNGRFLTAICGNRVSPCSLDIKIERPFVRPYSQVSKQLEGEIEALKNNIILSKYNILFNFSQFDDVFINKSDELRKKMKEYSDLLNKYEILHNKITNVMERKQNTESDENILRLKVKEIKEILNKKSITDQDISTVNEIYIETIIPLVNKIRNNKYNYIGIVNENKNETILKSDDISSLNDNNYNSRLIREIVSLNNELIDITSGNVISLNVKSRPTAKGETLKTKKSSTTKTLKKKLTVINEPDITL